MQLTRKVLIEKVSEFYLYDNLGDVPDSLWDKSYKELLKNKSSEEIFEFIAGKILLPFMKASQYEISKELFNRKDRIGTGISRRYITLHYAYDRHSSFMFSVSASQNLFNSNYPENLLKRAIYFIFSTKEEY